MPGPQPTYEYLKPEYLDTLTSSGIYRKHLTVQERVSDLTDCSAVGERDGGEAGLHPSNIHDNAYAIGTLDLTGDQSILLGPDGPSLGGFVCPVTTAKGEMWKLGQLHPGDKVHFQLLTLEQAETIRKNQDKNINLDYTDVVLPKPAQLDASYSIMAEGTHDNTDYKIRLQGEENILVEYGDMVLDIELRSEYISL